MRWIVFLTNIVLTIPLFAEYGCEQLTAVEPVVYSLENQLVQAGGTGTVGIRLLNDTEESCYYYPGILITSNSEYITFSSQSSCEDDSCFESWWYGMEGQWSYLAFADFQISPDAPGNLSFNFISEAVNLNCQANCPPDTDIWDCMDCPPSQPATIQATIGDPYPNRMGDVNLNSITDILDIVLVINNIISGYYESNQFYYDQDMGSHFADVNQDYSFDVQDIVLIAGNILNN